MNIRTVLAVVGGAVAFTLVFGCMAIVYPDAGDSNGRISGEDGLYDARSRWLGDIRETLLADCESALASDDSYRAIAIRNIGIDVTFAVGATNSSFGHISAELSEGTPELVAAISNVLERSVSKYGITNASYKIRYGAKALESQ